MEVVNHVYQAFLKPEAVAHLIPPKTKWRYPIPVSGVKVSRTCLVWSTGRVYITGVKCEQEAWDLFRDAMWALNADFAQDMRGAPDLLHSWYKGLIPASMVPRPIPLEVLNDYLEGPTMSKSPQFFTLSLPVHNVTCVLYASGVVMIQGKLATTAEAQIILQEVITLVKQALQKAGLFITHS